MAPDIVPNSGEVQETVTRRRIISAQKAAPPPNFWEYVAKLKPEDWSTPGGTPFHSLYIYRDQPPPTLCIAKCTTAVFADTSTAWNDQEEMEMAFQNRFGGGTYRLILKRGSERVCVAHMVVPGPYKNLFARTAEQPPANAYGQGQPANPGYANGGGNPQYDPTAAVAQTAIHSIANQDRQAIEIGISAIAQAANVIKNFQPNPAPSMADDLQRAFMGAMIARLTAPTPDPLDTFARMAAVMRESTSAASGGVGASVIDKVVSAVVDRGLNPPASASGPAVSMGAELVRILPNVAQYVTEGMGNYARIMEAQRDALAIQRGAETGYVIPPRTPPAPNPTRMAPAPSLAPAAAATPGNGTAQTNDVMTFIETKIIEILNEPQSAEWAAEETLGFLDRMDRTIVPQLASGGAKGLMSLFETRPALKPALKNPARLEEFIRSFLAYAAEASAKPN